MASQQQYFVILSLPRTGSTYLVDYLDAAPGVKCLSEVFNPEIVLLRHHQPSDGALADKDVRDEDPLGFLHRLEQRCRSLRDFRRETVSRAQREAPALLLLERPMEKIFLWRDNILEQYVSFLLASDRYGQASWERVDDDARLIVPTGALIDDLHAMEKRLYRRLRR
jgi:hypothetical protein